MLNLDKNTVREFIDTELDYSNAQCALKSENNKHLFQTHVVKGIYHFMTAVVQVLVGSN